MRTFSRFLAAALLSLIAVSAFAAPEIPQTFTFQGSGYGHGVGMSQIGARGQALEGKTAIDILRYYYSDVTVEPVADNQMMRVNIGHLLNTFSIRTASKLGQIQIFSGEIKDTIPPQSLRVLLKNAVLSFTVLGNTAFPSVLAPNSQVDPLPIGKSWTIRWTGTRYLQGDPAIASVKVGAASTKYRYGQIQVKLVKAAVLGYRLEVTNTVRLHDEYLWGIGEMPSSWPPAALQAQAIASRTYALNKSGALKTSCDCDIYGASQDQSFVGYSKEAEVKYGQLWKDAVNSTSTDDSTGLTILFNSAPISAFFFSSSGGTSESAQNAWGSALPYAMSVPDPWSLDPTINAKYSHWVRSATQGLVASAFGLPDVASLFIVNKNPSGTVASIVATSSTGVSVKLTGEVFRSRAKLPSAWFDVVNQQVIEPAPTATASSTPQAALGVRQ